MTPKASQGVATAFSRSVADSVHHLIGMSGRAVAHVIADAEMSRNYYYKRARYEMPFNTNDISKLAQAIGTTPDEIVQHALNLMNKNYTVTLPVEDPSNIPVDHVFRGYESNVTVGRFGDTTHPIPEQAVAYEDDGDTGEDLE